MRKQKMPNEEPEFIDTVITVRYAETDQMGIVYYANYLAWFEVGRVAWCRTKGFRYRDMETEDHRYMVVAEATCRYRAPARFEEEIVVRTAVAGATDKVIRFQYEICNKQTGQLLATGETTHVVTDPNLQPARLPDRYRPHFGLPLRHGK
jgi:acyl-CoA thioester hydrolase